MVISAAFFSSCTRYRIFQPLCLGGLVSYFAPGQTAISRTEAYYYAAGIVLCSLVPVVIFHHFILYIYQIGMKIRVACCSLLYKKVSDSECERVCQEGFFFVLLIE